MKPFGAASPFLVLFLLYNIHSSGTMMKEPAIDKPT